MSEDVTCVVCKQTFKRTHQATKKCTVCRSASGESGEPGLIDAESPPATKKCTVCRSASGESGEPGLNDAESLSSSASEFAYNDQDQFLLNQKIDELVKEKDSITRVRDNTIAELGKEINELKIYIADWCATEKALRSHNDQFQRGNQIDGSP